VEGGRASLDRLNTWNTTWLTDEKNNAKAFLKSTYASDYVISRDELPNWETYTIGIHPGSPGNAGRGAFGISLESRSGILSVHSDWPGTLSLYDLRGSRLHSLQIAPGGTGWRPLPGPGAYGMRFIRMRTAGGSAGARLPLE
jgi:hypothetical protein